MFLCYFPLLTLSLCSFLISDWEEEQVSSPNILRLIYQGRFLHGNVTLGGEKTHGAGLPLAEIAAVCRCGHEHCSHPFPEPQNRATSVLWTSPLWQREGWREELEREWESVSGQDGCVSHKRHNEERENLPVYDVIHILLHGGLCFYRVIPGCSHFLLLDDRIKSWICLSFCPTSSQTAIGEDHSDAFSCQRDFAGAKFPR